MKQVKALLVTGLCAVAILAAGYGGIVISSRYIMQNSDEPQPVNMSGNISKLFYSRLADDIELFPWNFYPSQEEIQQQGNESVFAMYDPYVEYYVFYTLIAIAAQVDQQEVSRWYDEENKTIMMSMVRGATGETGTEVYFYDDIVRLEGKKYEVKIACNDWSMISFSCIQCSEENIKETEEWEAKKEEFLQWMEKEPQPVEEMFAYLDVLYYYDVVNGTQDWGCYVELYQRNYEEFYHVLKQNGKEYDYEREEKEANEDTASQVVELKESIMVLEENGITMGLYYDVLNQRLSGFHYFYE